MDQGAYGRVGEPDAEAAEFAQVPIAAAARIRTTVFFVPNGIPGNDVAGGGKRIARCRGGNGRSESRPGLDLRRLQACRISNGEAVPWRMIEVEAHGQESPTVSARCQMPIAFAFHFLEMSVEIRMGGEEQRLFVACESEEAVFPGKMKAAVVRIELPFHFITRGKAQAEPETQAPFAELLRFPGAEK